MMMMTKRAASIVACGGAGGRRGRREARRPCECRRPPPSTPKKKTCVAGNVWGVAYVFLIFARARARDLLKREGGKREREEAGKESCR